MLPVLAILIAIYCEARLFDQLLNGAGWATRIVAFLAMVGVAIAAMLVMVLGETGLHLPH